MPGFSFGAARTFARASRRVGAAVPPVSPACQARRIVGVAEYSECLVDVKIPCGYRTSFFSLGCHCLHPRHREIAEQTIGSTSKRQGNLKKPVDIPAVKDFNDKTLIDVETKDGIVQLLPLYSRRGHGDQKWRLSIEGVVRTRTEVMEPGCVCFKGEQLGGHFSRSVGSKGLWAVTFEVIIPVPEYWGET